MKKETAHTRLYLSLFLRVTPLAVAMFLVIGYIVVTRTTESALVRVRVNHTSQQRHAELILKRKLDTLKDSVKLLAANDLVINALIDVENRSHYLPIFFRSLRIPGPGRANISLVDYKGWPIISNQNATTSYAAESFWEAVSRGREYFTLTAERLLFAAPVVYHGAAEGAVIVEYPSVQYPLIFNIGVGTDAFVITGKNGNKLFSHPPKIKLSRDSFFWQKTTLEGYGAVSIETGMIKEYALGPVKSLENFLLIAICLNILALLASLSMTAHIVTRPIVNLTIAIQKITNSGELNRRVEEAGPRELSEISKVFNRLISQLQKTMISRGELQAKIQERTREIEQMHGQMVMQEKMASVGQLAAGIAHELNNPINFVRTNFATLTENFTDLEAVFKDYRRFAEGYEARYDSPAELTAVRAKESTLQIDYILDDIPALFQESERGFERIARIIQSMRDFSHVDYTGDLSYFNINNGIEDTLVIARNVYKYHSDIQTDLGDLPDIQCLPEQLNQVFLNLIVNSAQAIEAQQKRAKGVIAIRTWREGKHVCCEIADNGPGIPKEILSRIYEPFFTTKAPGKGTGLGLSISYDIIVRKHGGELSVDCPRDGGTVFTLRIPMDLQTAGGKDENRA